MKKKIIAGVAVLTLFAGGATWYITTRPVIAASSIEKYKSKLSSLIDEVRSGHEKWNTLLLGVGNGTIDFVDLCSGQYAEQFRQMGTEFIATYQEFDRYRTANKTFHQDIPAYESYDTYFTTYRQIGEEMIAFADYVEAGDIDGGIATLDTLITLFNNLEEIN